MLTDTLRVQLHFQDPLAADAWLDALDDVVLVVDRAPDVVLTDGAIAGDVPAVQVSTRPSRSVLDDGFAGSIASDADPERVAAALNAVQHGLLVVPRETREQAPSLTPREQEVLELLANGLSNREIGAILQISAHTAKFHVQGLLDKLDASTRTEAAVRAARMFMI
jgi:DNA-binding NarL/FixJ family response regulator